MTQATDNGFNTDCIICLQLADEAMVTSCCVDLICASCLQKLPDKNKCPKCRKQKFSAHQELYVRRFIQQASPEIQFFVKPITGGGTIVIRLRQLDTLDMLFQRVYEKTNVPIAQIRLTCKGKNLTSCKKSLRSADITANCDVHQLGRLKGGKSIFYCY